MLQKFITQVSVSLQSSNEMQKFISQVSQLYSHTVKNIAKCSPKSTEKINLYTELTCLVSFINPNQINSTNSKAEICRL